MDALHEALGRWSVETGRLDVAIGELESLLAQGIDAPATEARIWRDLGVALGESGHFDRGIAAHERSLAIERELGAGPLHPTVIFLRERMANYLGRAGRTSLALLRYEEVLADLRNVLEVPLDLAVDVRASYAHLLGRAGRYAASVDMHQSVIADMRRSRPADDLALLRAQGNLAHRLSEAGRVLESIVEHEELLRVRTQVLGADHPATLITAANLAHWGFGACGEFGAAIEGHRASIQLMRRVMPSSHPALLRTRSRLAFWMAMSGDVLVARQEYEELVPEMQSTLGPHPEVVEARYNLGIACLELGDAEMAGRHLRAALRAWASGDEERRDALTSACDRIDVDREDRVAEATRDELGALAAAGLLPPRVSGQLEA